MNPKPDEHNGQHPPPYSSQIYPEQYPPSPVLVYTYPGIPMTNYYYRSGDLWSAILLTFFLTVFLSPIFGLFALCCCLHPRSRLGVCIGIGLGSIALGVAFLACVISVSSTYCSNNRGSYFCGVDGWYIVLASLVLIAGIFTTFYGFYLDRKYCRREEIASRNNENA